MEAMARHPGRALMWALWLVALLGLLLGGGARAGAQAVDDQGFWREPFLVPDPGVHTAMINRADVDVAERFVVTGSDDKSVRVWSVADGKLLRTIRVPAGPGNVGKVYAVALSPDGVTIAAAGWTGLGADKSIYFFDRATGEMAGRIGGLPNVVDHLAWSPDGTRLLATLGGPNGVRLYDASTRREVAADADYGDASYWGAFDHAGRIVTTSFDGQIRLYDASLARLAAVSAPGGKLPFGVAFSPDGASIAFGYHDPPRVDILDGLSLARLATPDTSGVDNGDLSKVAWSRDGTTLFAAGKWPMGSKSKLRSWPQAGRGKPTDHLASDNTVMSLLSLADGHLLVAAQDPLIALHGRAVWEVGPRTADFRGQVDALKLGVGGGVIQFGFLVWGEAPARFDLAGRRLDADPPADPSLHAASRDPAVTDWRDEYEPKRTGKRLVLYPYEFSRSLASAPGNAGFVLGTEWNLRRFTPDGDPVWNVAAPGAVWAVNVTEDGRLIVAAYGDGTIRWHRWTDGAEVLALFPHPDRKRWVAWTPAGYYVASPGGEDLITWQINRGQDQAPEVYTASRFHDRFYRPDVVDRVLDTLDIDQALALANQAAGRRPTTATTIEDRTPPRVAIIEPADQTFVDQPEVAVAYTIQDQPGTVIRRVRLLMDGRAGAETTDLTVPPSGRLSGELHVTLQGPDPLLTLLAENQNGSSDPATVRLRRFAGADLPKPDLYVLAAGINTFQRYPQLALHYAAADASDFADRMRRQEGGLYRRVLIRLLRNEEATQEALLDGLDWLERNVTQRDVAVVFLSTHGTNDSDGKLVFVAHDTDLSDSIRVRRTGLRQDDLRATLVKLAERGKTLVFLDACHSGNVRPGTKATPTDIDRYAAELATAESGVVVFSASTGTQLSIEDNTLKHGDFTAALLEAFDTRRATHEPPFLYVTDFDPYLRARVKELTHGAQTPTVTIPLERYPNARVFRIVAAP